VAFENQMLPKTNAAPVAKMPRGIIKGNGGTGWQGPEAMHPDKNTSRTARAGTFPFLFFECIQG